MRLVMTLSASVLALAAICLLAGDEPAPRRKTEKSLAQTAPKTAATASAKPGAPLPAKGAAKSAAQQPSQKAAASDVAPEKNTDKISDKNSADEQAIRETGATFAKAYDQGDAQAMAAHFTPDAEFIDEQGNVFQGRTEIEELMNTCIAENSGSTLDVTIDTIRFVGPGIAIEDGSTTVTRPAGGPSNYSHYTAVHVKTDGKWLTASSREHAPDESERAGTGEGGRWFADRGSQTRQREGVQLQARRRPAGRQGPRFQSLTTC